LQVAADHAVFTIATTSRARTDTTDTDYAATHKEYDVTTQVNKPRSLTTDVTPASVTAADTNLSDFVADDGSGNGSGNGSYTAEFTYTANTHGYTVVPEGTDGNPILGTTPVDETGTTGDPITVPDIPGYTPDPSASNTSVPGGNGSISVTYTANKQTPNINFVDQDENVVQTMTLTGNSGTAIDHSGVAAAITALTADGYTLINDGTLNATFDHDDTAVQTLTVTLKHQQRTLPSTGGDSTTKPATPAKPVTTTPAPAAYAAPTAQKPAATTTSTTTRTLPSTGGAKRTLPQTGDDQTNLLSALGLGMVGMLGLFGLAGKKRKDDDQ
jgi:LPXTG-motif cell wall-anchored protein